MRAVYFRVMLISLQWFLIFGSMVNPAVGDELVELAKTAESLLKSGRSRAALTSSLQLDARSKERHVEDTNVVIKNVSRIAYIYTTLGETQSAIPYFRRLVDLREKTTAPNDYSRTDAYVGLGQALLEVGGHSEEGIQLYKRAWRTELDAGRYSDAAKFVRSKLINILLYGGKADDAVTMQLDALRLRERLNIKEDRETADIYGALGGAYHELGRDEDAWRMYQRSLAIQQRVLKATDADIAITLSNLGAIALSRGNHKAAKSFFARCLDIRRKTLGARSKETAMAYDNLGEVYSALHDFERADQNYGKALDILTSLPGAEDGLVVTLNHAARLYRSRDYSFAMEMLNLALTTQKKIFGSNHPEVASTHVSLARYALQGKDTASAVAHATAAADIYVSRALKNRMPTPGYQRTEVQGAQEAFELAVIALHQAKLDESEAAERSLLLAQWALQTEADLAFAQLAARLATSNGMVSTTVRAYQDLQKEREDAEQRLVTALAAASNSADQLASRLSVIDIELQKLYADLKLRDPAFSTLFAGRPLTVADLKALMRKDEVAIKTLFIDDSDFGKRLFVWIIDAAGVRWTASPVAGEEVSDAVDKIRCSVDASRPAKTCKNTTVSGIPPFPAAAAETLYRSVFRPFATEITDKRIILVPSGPLATVPPALMLESIPKDSVTYPDYPWLIKSHVITILPSLSALAALRQNGPDGPIPIGLGYGKDRKTYLAFANPLLRGGDAVDRRLAADRKLCSDASAAEPLGTNQPKSPSEDEVSLVFRGPIARLDSVMALPPLPETATEVCQIAGKLNSAGHVYLGAKATLARIKRLQESGEIGTFGIVHFATHALLPEEIPTTSRARSEPALVLTPDNLESDDGLLYTSEIAQLSLHANLVLLSACNTAGAQNGSKEALSGLARAFIYAGSRSVLVSHWPVDSYGSSLFVSSLFGQAGYSPDADLGRAVQEAAIEFMKGADHNAGHPRFWAPFVLIGDGAM